MDHPDYQATLDYLYKHLPMFQRVGAVAYRPDLGNTVALCEALGNPQHQFKSIHVAGTNGKGSSSHMLAAIFQSAGYKTGLYTSPHLKNFTERIRINGMEVTQSFVVEFVKEIRPELEAIQPSFFETTVAMAFAWFARQQVDIAIVEVGLGGRLDSTNVITPEISLITNIGYDHMDILGDTLSLIATEKAGIIKPRVPVVISERQPEVSEVFEVKARECQSPIYFGSDEYHLEAGNESGSWDVWQGRQIICASLLPELKGTYQRKNIPGVWKTVELLRAAKWAISDDHLRTGIEKVTALTGLKGRWQQLGENPLIICDTGHNEDGIKSVLTQLLALPHRRLHLVIGMVRDKDISKVLGLLPIDASYYFCEAHIPRALPAVDLAAQAALFGLKGKVVREVNEAVADAKANAAVEDVIFVGGSTFVVAEINQL